YRRCAADLEFAALTVIPISARHGDNVTERSARMPWYDGPALLEHLETVAVAASADAQPFRFPVQWVNRPSGDFRGFSGTLAAGSIKPGDPVLVMGSGRQSRIKEVVTFDGALDRAVTGEAV